MSLPHATLPPSTRAGVMVLAFAMSSLLIHLAIMRREPLIEWLALVVLASVPFSVKLLELRWRAWLAFAALGFSLWLLVRVGGGRPLLYLPSMVIPAFLAWIFGRTLRAGQRPLIASVALA